MAKAAANGGAEGRTIRVLGTPPESMMVAVVTNRPVVVLVTGLQGTGKSTIAGCAGDRLAAAVLGWDWAMAGLGHSPELQATLQNMDRLARRGVGWTLLWQLATAELRRGRSVVLDGIARTEQVAKTCELARSHGAASLVVLCRCDDLATQRTRIESRRRDLPGWYELDWAHVCRARQHWEQPDDVDVDLDTTRPLEEGRSELLDAIENQY